MVDQLDTGMPGRDHVVRSWSISRISKLVLCIALGFTLCEGLVRLLVPDPIFYSTWFTPGIHEPDSEFGFVFAPNYRGAMRHKDGVWWEPLVLDSNGYRQLAGSKEAALPVIMLGGASMGFSFGLPDDSALHGQLQSALGDEHSVQSVSWPGFNLEQDLRKIGRAGDADRFKVAIVFAYSQQDYEPAARLNQTPKPKNLHLRDGVVLPDDPAAGMFGSLYYRSMVVAGFARWIRAAEQKLGRRSDTAFRVDSIPIESQNEGQPLAVLAAEQLLASGIGRVFVVALPHQLRVNGPETLPFLDSHAITWIDLRDLRDDERMDWIAGGHYGPKSAQQIVSRIMNGIEQ